MKRIFIGLMAFIALIGLINCVVIEPAHAYKEDKAVSSSTDDSKCCFFCCSLHHQWLPSVSPTTVFASLISVAFISSVSSFSPDPPVGSIFRPPLV